jgi:crossover junction endodeoxyribonuclease RusA
VSSTLTTAEGLSFDIPMPPSVNSMFKNVPGKGRVRTKEYRAWSHEAGWMLIAQRNQHHRHQCITGPIEIGVAAYKPANKKRDLDNILKAVCDLLTNTNTIADDSQIVAINARWVDAGVPCTVTVRPA